MLNTKKLYLGYFEGSSDSPIIEGSKTKVTAFIKKNYRHEYKSGKVRIGYTVLTPKNEN